MIKKERLEISSLFSSFTSESTLYLRWSHLYHWYPICSVLQTRAYLCIRAYESRNKQSSTKIENWVIWQLGNTNSLENELFVSMDVWECCVIISLQHDQYPQRVEYMFSYSLYHSTRNPHRTILLSNGKNVVGRSSACHITYPESVEYLFLSHHVSSMQSAASCCSY